jgi:two-component system, OmpR family, KDP operon response regulator KdpE
LGGSISHANVRARLLLLYMEPSSAAAFLHRLPEERYELVACTPSSPVARWIEEIQPELVLITGSDNPSSVVEMCTAVRGWTDRPVVLLSERTEETVVSRVLETGVDEYLILPMGDQELFARIDALLRRANRMNGSNGAQHIGGLTLSSSEQSVTNLGRKIYLSPIQFRLLSCLASAPGKVLTHQTLMSRVWGAEYVDSRHYLRLYIRYLREKLEADPTNPTMILSEWGVGYRFEPPLPNGASPASSS